MLASRLVAVRGSVSKSTTVGARKIHFGISKIPDIKNETLFNYAPSSPERVALMEACKKVRNTTKEIPLVIGGKEIFTGKLREQRAPSDHKVVLARSHQADKEIVKSAIQNAVEAWQKWSATSFEDRAAIFLRAADLLSTKYRAEVCAATMLGQGKTIWQAEIDAAAEVIDFLRLNVKYAEEVYQMQPPLNSPGVWNRVEYRPLEGFVLSISPFNFTAIGANLATSPAIMGNVVLWKPASTAILSNYVVFQALREAGLPDGVIQFMPCDGSTAGSALESEHFAALHFTGSTGTFNFLWNRAAQNISKYRTYPRLVGETGGKNFHFIHESAVRTDAGMNHVVSNLIRSAFEYSGQKCSACSRAYIPDSAWPKLKAKLLAELQDVKVGQADDPTSFMSAVIDKASFDNIKGYIEYAHSQQGKTCEIIAGGKCDDSVGYFIQPTVIVTTDPAFKTIQEEIFGPVLTIYVYEASQYEKTLELCDKTSPYALTGAIFSNDRYATALATEKLRHSAGNFYINDKSTGAVVGQQPFGGARASGTNDKAGASSFMARWVSPRSIKENFIELSSWRYPSMLPDAK